MNFGESSGRRFKRGSLSKDGDIVIVSASRAHHQALRLESGKIYNCKYGHFHHNDMIGQLFGSWIVSRKRSNKQRRNGELCLLRLSCELWTKSLSHRTQILYEADKSLITFLLAVRPNDIVYESGTGSGSLSSSFSRIISPNGHLFTFEFNQKRAEFAKNDFKNLGIDKLITVIQRDIVQNGFPKKEELILTLNEYLTKEQKIEKKEKEKNEYKDSFGSNEKIEEFEWCTDEKMKNLKIWKSKLSEFEGNEFVSSVFLDLPKPAMAVQSAHNVLMQNGKICSFSPCIEQVQRMCESLSKCGFVDIRCFEVLSRDILVRKHDFVPLDLMTNNSIHSIRSRPNNEICKEEKLKNSMITSRPVGKTFGHTGYLTFAIKALKE